MGRRKKENFSSTIYQSVSTDEKRTHYRSELSMNACWIWAMFNPTVVTHT